MKKVALIQAALAAGLGSEKELNAKTAAELTTLCRENIEGFAAKLDAEARREDELDARGGDEKGEDPRLGKKIKVRIEKGDGPDGKLPIYGNVNGYNFEAPRGKEIELDEGFVRHLETTMVEDYEPVLDEKGRATGETKEVQRRRFNITRL